jgi:MFS family permease
MYWSAGGPARALCCPAHQLLAPGGEDASPRPGLQQERPRRGIVRPVGALLFGHIGDRSGRQAALTLSVLAMAVPTSLIGVLPDHAQIGITASVLLVGLRLVQGVSVGGENPTSVVFLVEGAAPDQRGLMWRALL